MALNRRTRLWRSLQELGKELVKEAFADSVGGKHGRPQSARRSHQARPNYAADDTLLELADPRLFPHVASINALVYEIRQEHPDQYVPYVSPEYGGTRARVLAVSQYPGWSAHKASVATPTLSVDNTDGTTVRFKQYLDGHGIPVEDVTAWNAFPWTGPRNKTPQGTRQAADALKEVLKLCPDVEVVLLLGLVAQEIWDLVVWRDQGEADGYLVVKTYNTSPRAVEAGRVPPARIEQIEASLHDAFGTVQQILAGAASAVSEVELGDELVDLEAIDLESVPFDWAVDLEPVDLESVPFDEETADGAAMHEGEVSDLFAGGLVWSDVCDEVMNQRYWHDLIDEGRILTGRAEGEARDLTIPRRQAERDLVRELAEQYRESVGDVRERTAWRPEHQLQNVVDAYRRVHADVSDLTPRGIGRSH